VLVHEVRAGGPAGTAGIARGDILIGADSHVIEGLDDLHRFLSTSHFGDEATLRVLRELALLEVKVTLAEPTAE
jgi:S1-C subfamily serine protease